MDKYEFKIKAEQMQQFVQRRDYKMAAKIADGIEWRRVKNVELLLTVSEIYEKMGRLEDSYEILNMAYDRAPIGRTIVYKMAEMAIRMGEFEEATELYKEFVEAAPHDLNRYILKYKIYQATGRSVEDQISVLEEFKSREYHERWAYELASLYYKEGMNDKCVEECDDLILWFSEGEYVRKAMELKMRIQPLTASQEEKYQELAKLSGTSAKGKKPRRPQEEKKPVREEAPLKSGESLEAETEEEIHVRPVNPDERYSTVNLQAELAEGLRDLLSEEQRDESRKVQESKAREEQERKNRKERENRSGEEQESKSGGDQERKSGKEQESKKRKEWENKSGEDRKAHEEAVLEAVVRPQKDTGKQKEKERAQGERLRLGQSEDGQLTFNAEENVLDRQITGQMTIEEVMAEWEAKRQKMKVKLDELAEKEEERKKEEEIRRKEEERLSKERRAAGLETEDGLPNLIPPDVQLLLDEIEGKLPVKIIVEPIERAASKSREESEAGKPLDGAGEERVEDSLKETEADFQDITEEEEPRQLSGSETEEEVSYPEERTKEGYAAGPGFMDISAGIEEDLPEDIDEDEIEGILEAALQEELEALEKEKEPAKASRPVQEEKPVQREPKEDSKHASNMMWDLEKVLEDELKHVSGQYLTEEQEKLFAYFTSVHGMNQQLSQFLEEEQSRELDGTSTTGNLVVTGESGNGKTTLAIDMVKAVQKQRRAKGSKVARVTGKALSQKDVAAVVRKLSGGALVIERAGGLTAEAAAKLSSAMLGQTENLFVVLEDDASEIRKLFTRCESLAAKFDKTIEIPVFTNNELVAFGKSYALEQGYVLDEMAVLALYNRIGNNQTSDHLVNVSEVKELIDDAIISASRKGVKKLFSKRRQDEFGNYVLMEKDFEE